LLESGAVSVGESGADAFAAQGAAGKTDKIDTARIPKELFDGSCPWPISAGRVASVRRLVVCGKPGESAHGVAELGGPLLGARDLEDRVGLWSVKAGDG